MFQNARIVGVGVNPKAYHALKDNHPRGHPEHIMSPSELNLFAKLPSKWVRGYEPPGSESKSWGNLVDCRTLTPEMFEATYAVQPPEYPCAVNKCPSCGSVSDAKKCRACGVDREKSFVNKPWTYQSDYCAEWRALKVAQGLDVVSAARLQQADEAVARLMEPMDGDDTIKRWFEASDRQVHVAGEWKDEATGLVVPVACLIDFRPRAGTEFADCLGDLKSTTSAHPIRFGRQAFEFGYHRQAAFDLDLYNAATEDTRCTWAFILTENFPPWEPNRAIFGQDQGIGQPGYVELGREVHFGGYKGLMSAYCQCIKSNRWPGYNAFDESIQGWSVLRVAPFMAERATFDPKIDYGSAPTPAQELCDDDIPH